MEIARGHPYTCNFDRECAVEFPPFYSLDEEDREAIESIWQEETYDLSLPVLDSRRAELEQVQLVLYDLRGYEREIRSDRNHPVYWAARVLPRIIHERGHLEAVEKDMVAGIAEVRRRRKLLAQIVRAGPE